MINSLFNFLYPRQCVLCQQPVEAEDTAIDLCPDCEDDLPVIKHACWQCGIPLAVEQNQHLCGQCQQKPPAYDRVISIYHYQQPVSWMIQRMKFARQPALARLLASLVSEKIRHNITDMPDALIPVPLHPRRQFERGFNQSHDMAVLLSQTLHCPVDSRLVERHLNNPHQTGLDAKQRKKNVKNIFRVKNKTRPSYQHVAIIDDVMSTGSTINELARTLKKSGVEQVDAWVIARADNK